MVEQRMKFNGWFIRGLKQFAWFQSALRFIRCSHVVSKSSGP